MPASQLQASSVKLSICISTFNRANVIQETIESILPQLQNGCELLVVDNASTDDTERVMASYAGRHPGLRYVRQNTNEGLDCNFDRAVQLAHGDYCWLMSDDDVFKAGAVTAVLDCIAQNPSVVFVNAEVRDVTLSRLLQSKFLDHESNRTYGGWELDRILLERGDFVRYIGAVVIKRSIWLARDREPYYGSFFVYIGVIFQRRLPRPVHVIAQPLISYRAGNTQSFSSRGMDIVLVRWPSLVASLSLSESTKRKLHSAQPMRRLHQLLIWRAAGRYSLVEYRLLLRPQLHSLRDKLIPLSAALFPGAVANAILLLYYSAHQPERWRQLQGLYLAALRNSPFHYRQWHALSWRKSARMRLQAQQTSK